MEELLGAEDARRIANAEHMPSYVGLRIARALREGRDRLGLDPFAFLALERNLATLIDVPGGCERIKATPLPRL